MGAHIIRPVPKYGQNPEAENIIVLVGPKHAGKTSAGRALASLRGGVFIDLDVLLEEQTGSSPRELYRKGPDLFRRAETEALANALAPDSKTGLSTRIIAAGGGIIDNPSAVDLLRTSGAALVYLEVPPETAWERIRQSGGLPPFLDAADPETAHRELHLRRGALYKKITPITVAADRGSPGDIGREIDRLLKERRHSLGRAPAAQS
ncbi:MAG: shikimate kinase [Treponema sp.]|jgi:shikimate kinase|nr:shikimate kinase [Treponema sp.]